MAERQSHQGTRDGERQGRHRGTDRTNKTDKNGKATACTSKRTGTTKPTEMVESTGMKVLRWINDRNEVGKMREISRQTYAYRKTDRQIKNRIAGWNEKQTGTNNGARIVTWSGRQAYIYAGMQACLHTCR